MSFNVSDRVRVNSPQNNLAHNQDGTVMGEDKERGAECYYVKLDNLPFNRPYYIWELVKL